MKIKTLFLSLFVVLSFCATGFAQNLKRTTTKIERAELSAGGTVTIVGAPFGAISIEGWQNREVEITAEITVEAASINDLDLLAKVNNFVVDEDFNHVRILTNGIHDKQFVKKNFKKLPKQLLALPWRVDYKIKVPMFCDLNIDAGRGNFDLKGVEGAIAITALQSDTANLELVGGFVQATFGGDRINVKLVHRGWRGAGVDLQVARGALNITAPVALNSDLNLSVLKTGKIENKFENLKPRDKTKFTENSIVARTGVGGAKLLFSITDGNLTFSPQ